MGNYMVIRVNLSLPTSCKEKWQKNGFVENLILRAGSGKKPLVLVRPTAVLNEKTVRWGCKRRFLAP